MPHKELRNNKGVTIPSVTQILGVIAKQHLYKWYGTHGWEECERIKRESAEHGTRIHEVISQYLKDQPVDQTIPELCTFVNDWSRMGRSPIEVEPEAPYQSKKYGYQGTFDWIERDEDGTLVVADLKVTNSIYPEMSLQLSAYAQLYNEVRGTEITKGRIYNLNKKTGKLQIKEYDDLDKLFPVFRSLISVWKWVNNK